MGRDIKLDDMPHHTEPYTYSVIEKNANLNGPNMEACGIPCHSCTLRQLLIEKRRK